MRQIDYTHTPIPETLEAYLYLVAPYYCNVKQVLGVEYLSMLKELSTRMDALEQVTTRLVLRPAKPLLYWMDNKRLVRQIKRTQRLLGAFKDSYDVEGLAINTKVKDYYLVTVRILLARAQEKKVEDSQAWVWEQLERYYKQTLLASHTGFGLKEFEAFTRSLNNALKAYWMGQYVRYRETAPRSFIRAHKAVLRVARKYEHLILAKSYRQGSLF